MRIIIVTMVALAACGTRAADGAMTFNFDDGIGEAWESDNCKLVDGRDGRGLMVADDARVSMSAPEMLCRGFEIDMWVMHRVALSELHYEELVYLYHRTANLKNRICLKKRIGTDRIVFAMSDSGPGKGAEFAGDWYAMVSEPLDWQPNSWHHLRVIANHSAGRAVLLIDGEQVASAKGNEFPAEAGTLWLGSLAGRSHAQAIFDSVTITGAGE